jgi:hypothetical protein
MRWFAAATLATLTTVLAAPTVRSAEQPGLAGLYLCEGTDVSGSAYRGFVEIDSRGDTLVLTWMFPDGTERGELRLSAVGVGIASGESLSVSYFGKTAAGLVVYRIETGNQRLVGKWTVAGGDGVLYEEVLTKLGAGGASPGRDQAPQPQKKPVPVPGGLTL